METTVVRLLGIMLKTAHLSEFTNLPRGVGRKRTSSQRHPSKRGKGKSASGGSGERKFVRARRNFEAFVDNAPAAVFVKDQDGRYVYLNRQWEKALDRGADECLGKTDLDLWPPDVASRLHRSDSDAFASKGPLEEIETTSGKDGMPRYWMMAKFPIAGRSGTKSVAGVAVDFTEHMRAEEKVARLNRTYSVLSKINRVIVRTPAPRILFEEVCRIAVEDGQFRMAWVGLVDPDTDLVKPVAKSGFDDGFLDGAKFSLDDLPEGQGPPSVAIRDGTYSICNDIERDRSIGPWRMKAYVRGYRSCAAFPLTKENKVVGALTLFSSERDFFDDAEIRLLYEICGDISFALETAEHESQRTKDEEELRTYSRHLEDMVENRSRELQESERMAAIGKTALMIGHDLRNPLQSITYALYQIKEMMGGLPQDTTGASKEKGSAAVATIGEQIEYMDKIVSDLQDYARPLVLEPIETDLAALIKDTFSGINVPRNIHVSVNVEDGLHKLKIDPGMIRRAFTCLLSNAIDAMPRGGSLVLEAKENDGVVSIDFRDTGIGISKENLGKLSTPLFTTRAKGMGFGLAISRRLIEAHGGSMEFDSKVGKGTTVTVKIPYDPLAKHREAQERGIGGLIRHRRQTRL